MRLMRICDATVLRRWRGICAVTLVLAVAAPTWDPTHDGFHFIAVAHADDDDDDDGGGGGRSYGGRGGGNGPGGVYRRNRGTADFTIFRRLFQRQKPPVRRARRPSPVAPPPVLAPNEIVAVGVSDAERLQIEALGYTIGQEDDLAVLGGTVVRIVAPPGSDLQQSLAEIRAVAPAAAVDFNHFYRPNAQEDACVGGHCLAPRLIGWPQASAASSSCTGEGLALGLIDTAINADHAAFSHGRVEVLRVGEKTLPESGRQHGTAVAALLVGAADSRTPGLLPGARLIAADPFHRAGRSDDRTDAFDLARALDRLAGTEATVINLSLAGPANQVLERTVRGVAGNGVLLVAAAGNDGPNAAPTYPAAYEDVIAVTAVDTRKRVYRRAGRGDHIDLAAPGVDVWAAASVSGVRPKTGTSFAAPFVTAAVALAARNRGEDAERLLFATAEDLGEPGKDPVYGWGLLNAQFLCGTGSGTLDPKVAVD